MVACAVARRRRSSYCNPVRQRARTRCSPLARAAGLRLRPSSPVSGFKWSSRCHSRSPGPFVKSKSSESQSGSRGVACQGVGYQFPEKLKNIFGKYFFFSQFLYVLCAEPAVSAPQKFFCFRVSTVADKNWPGLRQEVFQ